MKAMTEAGNMQNPFVGQDIDLLFDSRLERMSIFSSAGLTIQPAGDGIVKLHAMFAGATVKF